MPYKTLCEAEAQCYANRNGGTVVQVPYESAWTVEPPEHLTSEQRARRAGWDHDAVFAEIRTKWAGYWASKGSIPGLRQQVVDRLVSLGIGSQESWAEYSDTDLGNYIECSCG